MNWSTVLSFLTFGGLSFANPVFLFLLVFPALVIWQALRQQNQRKNQK